LRSFLCLLIQINKLVAILFLKSLRYSVFASCHNVFKLPCCRLCCRKDGKTWQRMKIKCLECGRRIKAKKRCAECHKEKIRKQKAEYYQKNKEKFRERTQKNRQRYYQKNKEKCLACDRRRREQHREQLRAYNRQYYQKNRHRIRLYNQIHTPFEHGHDKTTDLTIENGRVKGAVWLENQQQRYKIAWKGNTRYYGKGKGLCSCIEKPFFIAEKNNRTYCFECGGKFLIAFENDYYTITEVCCCFCGVVLPQTTP